jgi:hypothetical protein
MRHEHEESQDAEALWTGGLAAHLRITTARRHESGHLRRAHFGCDGQCCFCLGGEHVTIASILTSMTGLERGTGRVASWTRGPCDTSLVKSGVRER